MAVVVAKEQIIAHVTKLPFITDAKEPEHITSLLAFLHWFSVSFPIDFKILLLTLKVQTATVS